MKIIFLGPPGAGKGTLSKMIQNKYNLSQISTGDIFREAISNKSSLGKKIKEIVDKGSLVPDDLTINLIKERLSKNDTKKGYILDGFPRTIPQAEQLSQFENIDLVINLDISDENIIIERLSGRRTCRLCNAIYHIKNNPPTISGKCNKCGGDLYIRDDDQIPSIKRRLKEYKNKTQPLIDYYNRKGLLKDFDASGTPEDLLKQLEEHIKK